MKAAAPDAAKLLRWYPRGWRERYGEEFLAMVEDWLDGDRPGWRLRLSVAWAGLRERGHQALLAGGLVAVPAFARYLRAGGWPEIRRRIAWAAGATAAAGGALAGLLLASRSHTFSQLNVSGAYFADVLATTLALVVALWLWSAAVTAMAKRLDLAPRVRAAEKRLGAVAMSTAFTMIPVSAIWYAVIQSSVFMLFLGMSVFAVRGLGGYMTIRRAARRLRPGSARRQ